GSTHSPTGRKIPSPMGSHVIHSFSGSTTSWSRGEKVSSNRTRPFSGYSCRGSVSQHAAVFSSMTHPSTLRRLRDSAFTPSIFATPFSCEATCRAWAYCPGSWPGPTHEFRAERGPPSREAARNLAPLEYSRAGACSGAQHGPRGVGGLNSSRFAGDRRARALPSRLRRGASDYTQSAAGQSSAGVAGREETAPRAQGGEPC